MCRRVQRSKRWQPGKGRMLRYAADVARPALAPPAVGCHIVRAPRVAVLKVRVRAEAAHARNRLKIPMMLNPRSSWATQICRTFIFTIYVKQSHLTKLHVQAWRSRVCDVGDELRRYLRRRQQQKRHHGVHTSSKAVPSYFGRRQRRPGPVERSDNVWGGRALRVPENFGAST